MRWSRGGVGHATARARTLRVERLQQLAHRLAHDPGDLLAAGLHRDHRGQREARARAAGEKERRREEGEAVAPRRGEDARRVAEERVGEGPPRAALDVLHNHGKGADDDDDCADQRRREHAAARERGLALRRERAERREHRLEQRRVRVGVGEAHQLVEVDAVEGLEAREGVHRGEGGRLDVVLRGGGEEHEAGVVLEAEGVGVAEAGEEAARVEADLLDHLEHRGELELRVARRAHGGDELLGELVLADAEAAVLGDGALEGLVHAPVRRDVVVAERKGLEPPDEARGGARRQRRVEPDGLAVRGGGAGGLVPVEPGPDDADAGAVVVEGRVAERGAQRRHAQLRAHGVEPLGAVLGLCGWVGVKDGADLCERERASGLHILARAARSHRRCSCGRRRPPG